MIGVWEDDGCGVVGYACARKLADLACATNCADDLIVTGVNYNNSRPVLPGKVVISASFAQELYTACNVYAWCGTQQQQTSSCSFLSVTVKRSSYSSGSSASVQTLSQPDTCTFVGDLDLVSFAENIIGVIVHTDDNPLFAVTPVQVPYVGAASRGAVAWSCTAVAAMLLAVSALIMRL